MSAGCALNCASGIFVSHDERLDLTHFSRAQYPSQSRHTSAIALGFVQSFANEILMMPLQRFVHHSFRLFPGAVVGQVAQVCGEPAQYFLPNIGMKLAL